LHDTKHRRTTTKYYNIIYSSAIKCLPPPGQSCLMLLTRMMRRHSGSSICYITSEIRGIDLAIYTHCIFKIHTHNQTTQTLSSRIPLYDPQPSILNTSSTQDGSDIPCLQEHPNKNEPLIARGLCIYTKASIEIAFVIASLSYTPTPT
jgi:hypothetical protein